MSSLKFLCKNVDKVEIKCNSYEMKVIVLTELTKYFLDN